MKRVEQWLVRHRDTVETVAYVAGAWSLLGSLGYFRWALAAWERKATEGVELAVAATAEATQAVHDEIRELSRETARAQRLAVKVGVATAVLGAVLGGFAGAVAARLLGA